MTAGAEPIDREHLRRQTGGDAAVARDVLRLFRDVAAADVARLLESGEADERRRLAHKIRGAALGVGAFALAEAAGRIESGPSSADAEAALGRALAEADAAAVRLLDEGR
jgi:HPt (histidine-containing phosphotransfer) domain-containing protein